MNQLEFSNLKASFLQRRYAVRLGKRYAIAAAGVILLGFVPIHHEKASWSVLKQYDEGLGQVELK